MTIFKDLQEVTQYLQEVIDGNKHVENLPQRSVHIRAHARTEYMRAEIAQRSFERIVALIEKRFSDTVLRSGEAPEVLTPEQQDARSWELIERWYAQRVESMAYKPAMNIGIDGPYVIAPGTAWYYVRLPGGHTARGNSRSDALAHAAQYCANEMAKCRAVRVTPEM